MPFDIQPQFKQLGNQALDNYDKDAVPRFPGNEAVPIQANIRADFLSLCRTRFCEERLFLAEKPRERPWVPGTPIGNPL